MIKAITLIFVYVAIAMLHLWVFKKIGFENMAIFAFVWPMLWCSVPIILVLLLVVLSAIGLDWLSNYIMGFL